MNYTKMFSFLQLTRAMCSNSSAKSVRNILLSKPIGNRYIVKGWLKSLRKYKKVVFLHLDDGSSLDRLQVVVPSEIAPKGMTYHACLSIEGLLVKSQGQQEVELVADNIEVVSKGAPEDYPFTEKMTYKQEDLRLIPHFRPRVRNFASMFRIRSQLKMCMRKYFDQENFVSVDAPLLTTNDCEGNGNAFAVKGQGNIKPHVRDVQVGDGIFGHPVYLTVSGQMHLEAMANGLSKVYCFNPAFRCEGDSRLHLHEFWMLESEERLPGASAQLNYQLLMDRIEEFIKFTIKEILDQCQDDVEYQWKFNKEKEVLEKLINKSLNNLFLRLPYSEVMNIITNHKNELKYPVEEGENLNKECELFLTKHTNGIPIFVTDWPKQTKPFYMLTDNDNSIAFGIDLLVPGIGEIVGGGLREHCVERLSSSVVERGLEEVLQWYVDLRKWGYEPTGGFGLGFERFIQYLLGIDNIKDTIPYPRSNGQCLC